MDGQNLELLSTFGDKTRYVHVQNLQAGPVNKLQDLTSQ